MLRPTRSFDVLDEVIDRLRSVSWWPDPVDNLGMIANAHVAEAQMNAGAWAGMYNAERGAMIVDVIASAEF